MQVDITVHPFHIWVGACTAVARSRDSPLNRRPDKTISNRAVSTMKRSGECRGSRLSPAAFRAPWRSVRGIISLLPASRKWDEVVVEEQEAGSWDGSPRCSHWMTCAGLGSVIRERGSDS